MRGAKLTVAFAVLGILLGCKSVGPDFKAPSEPVSSRYEGLDAGTQARDGAPRATAEDPTPSFWWQEFHDPELNRLEDRAAHDNLDLQAAYLRIVESRIQVQTARAQGLPNLNGTASFSREQLGFAGILKSQGVAAGAPGSVEAGLISSLERPVNIYQLGFDATWELDLFGRVRRSVEAADAQSAGAVESRNDLLVSLQAEVAEAYLQLRAGQQLHQITVALIDAQREVFELTQNRQQHGLSSEADTETARAQWLSLQSQLPPFDQTIATSSHALAVLVGETPDALSAEFEPGELPSIPGAVPVGMPSTLARRRPDIRGAEAQLHAATAEIGVSVASLFPDISLTGSYGVRNTGTRYLFDWESKFYTFGPSISIPIFHGGAIIANVRLSRAEAAEAALNYRKTVLGALQEVEDGLTNLAQDAARTSALQGTVTANQRALQVDTESYDKGLITYINVLTVQIQTVQAQQQLAQAQLNQATDLVKLYKALGGGWQAAPTDAGKVAAQ